MTGYTGDMQRNANGTPSKNQGKAAMTITLQDINEPCCSPGLGVEVLEVFGKNYCSISFGQLSGYIVFCPVPIWGAKPPPISKIQNTM